MRLAGVELEPMPSGGLWWRQRRLLAVSDLHLEKGSSHAARGVPLPPYDTAATLAAIERDVAALDPRIVVCLGDSFHDRHAPQRLVEADRDRLLALARGRHWFWVAGNHDPAPPAALDGDHVLELAVGPLVFRHCPRPDAAEGELAGHLHPKAAVTVRGRRIARRCFVGDGRRAVLPAYGAYAGGLDVRDPAFRPLFPAGFAAWLCGRDRVHHLDAAKLGRAR